MTARRSIAAAGAALLLGLLPQLAQAQGMREYEGYQPSSQWFAVELKFGIYRPNIDKELGGAQPYQDIFGRKFRLMSQATFDFQFFKKHGTLAVGGTIGLVRATGNALLDSTTLEPSGDTTRLHLVPLILSLIYRWDYLAKRYRVPIVPFVRVGLVYAFWWVTQGDGKIARFDAGGDKARGGNFGYTVNVGLSLPIGLLEPRLKKQMDIEAGINSVHLFAEFVHTRIDDFGAAKALRIGMDASFLAGLAFEF